VNALRRYQLTNLVLFALTAGHALVTWSVRDALVLFGGGIAVAFAAEVVGVAAGLLDHELRPQVAGVPLSILLAWPAVVYASFRLALLVADGLAAAAVAAVVATALDLVTDPNGVREGVWSYPDHPLSEPRYRDVPWWNFAAWLVITFLTAALPSVVG
jgi:uncharacterized membrane protein